jgi:hypothetical protein
MNDENERSVASAGYGYAGRFLFGLALAAALAVGCESSTKPKSPQGYVTVCSGCGTEFWSPSWGGPPKPITKCPNCPMSEEEWEALKEQMRKRTEKP